MRKRLFLAIELPEELQAEVVGLQKKLQEFDQQVKWVEPENLHLTLQFFGWVAGEKVDSLISELRSKYQNQPRFKLKLGGKISFHPSAKNPRVILIKAYLLDKTQLDLEKPLHLTLGRIRGKTPSRLKTRLVQKAQALNLDKLACFEIEVKRLCLKHSQLSPAGPAYHNLASLALA